MKKLLPEGFTSWIQFHDYLKKSKPELFRYKTIRFMSFSPNGQAPSNPIEAYSISIAALERLCWKEVQPLRVSIEDTLTIQHAREMGHNPQHPQIMEIMTKVNKLLQTLMINNGTY